MENVALDATDREILSLLMEDARISFRELGEKVGLSANAAADRVRRLRDRGVISGFTAVLDPVAGGRGIDAMVDLRIAGPEKAQLFEKTVRALDVVTDAAHVTGRFDYQLRLACESAEELDATIRALKLRAGVVETDTRLVLRSVLKRPLTA